jgi:hypothetical protein
VRVGQHRDGRGPEVADHKLGAAQEEKPGDESFSSYCHIRETVWDFFAKHRQGDWMGIARPTSDACTIACME